MATAVCKQSSIFKILGTWCKIIECRQFHAASVLRRSVTSWRISQGLPSRGNEYGPLTDLPDWSYADGRPAPLLEAQKRKIHLQKQYFDQIRMKTTEVDYCLDLNRQKAEREEKARQEAVRNRLKPKGEVL